MCNDCNCGDGGCGDDHGHEEHGHGHDTMDCCHDHHMSKEHLELKKKLLEEKLAWINEQLAETDK